jgi:hypothetical protein
MKTSSATARALLGFGSADSATVAETAAGSTLVDPVMPTVADREACEFNDTLRPARRPSIAGAAQPSWVHDPCSPMSVSRAIATAPIRVARDQASKPN